MRSPALHLRNPNCHIQFPHGQEDHTRRHASLIEKGFAAVASDIARVQQQVNSIEAELKYGRYETRLGKLEEKVFGAPRR